MKELFFKDTDNLCLHILDIFDNFATDEFDIGVIAKYDVARRVLSGLCSVYDICEVEIESQDYCGYDKEFIIALNKDGVWCEPAYRNGRYLEDETTIVFIHEDCNSAILKAVKPILAYVFSVGDDSECEEVFYDDECDENCEECPYFEYGSNVEFEDLDYDEDGLHGFSLSFSDDESRRFVSYYSTENINEDILNMLIEQFKI